MNKNSNFYIVVVITICTLFGKVLGIVRDCLISYYYGTTADTDAFFLAMSVPTILLGVFTASTDSAIIPQYKRIMEYSSKEKADQLFAMIVNTLSVIAILASICIFIWPNEFVRVFAIGFSKDTNYLASLFLRIFSPIGLLHLWYCFFCTYNAAFKRNVVRSILAFSTNFIVIVSVLIIRGEGLIYLAVAYLISNAVCAFLPLVEMRILKYRHSFKIVKTNGEYGRFWKLFVPIMGGALLNDVQQYVDKNLCSDIIGGISYLNYGIKLVSIFDSILVVGLGVVILPMLSDFEIKKDFEEFSSTISRITRLMMELLLPFLSILFIMGKELISLLYGRGKFDYDSIIIVSSVLKVYSPLILFTPLVTIFSKFFHVKEKNGIPFIINFVGVLGNTLLSIILKRYMSTVGVAFATTISMVIEIIIYVIIIQKEIKWDMAEVNCGILFPLIMPTLLIFIINKTISFSWEIGISIVVKTIIVFCTYLLFYMVFLRKDMNFLAKKCLGIIKKN